MHTDIAGLISLQDERRSCAGLLRMAIAVAAVAVTGGCGTQPMRHATRTSLLSRSPRPLTASEMDLITIGNARATSSGAARAAGMGASGFSVSNDSSITGGNPIAGAPITAYAMSQTQSVADGTSSAHAEAKSLTSTTDGHTATVAATLNAAAQGTPPTAQASAALKVFAVGMTNGTHVLFGSVSATACCVPDATTTASAALSVVGPYSEVARTSPLDIHPQTSQSAIEFAAAASPLPLLNPSLLQAATAGPGF